MSSAMYVEISDQYWRQAQTLVKQGWAGNMEEVVNESLRRYLESHQGVVTVSFTQEDVEWGGVAVTSPLC